MTSRTGSRSKNSRSRRERCDVGGQDLDELEVVAPSVPVDGKAKLRKGSAVCVVPHGIYDLILALGPIPYTLYSLMHRGSWGWQRNWVDVSQRTIAAQTGLARSTVQEALGVLTRRGLIVRGATHQSGTRYTVRLPLGAEFEFLSPDGSRMVLDDQTLLDGSEDKGGPGDGPGGTGKQSTGGPGDGPGGTGNQSTSDQEENERIEKDFPPVSPQGGRPKTERQRARERREQAADAWGMK
ncbi:MAG: helix-turn-helix domain-containing protein [bacterium]